MTCLSNRLIYLVTSIQVLERDIMWHSRFALRKKHNSSEAKKVKTRKRENVKRGEKGKREKMEKKWKNEKKWKKWKNENGEMGKALRQ